MQNYIILKKRIKKNEGFRSLPYLDQLGHLTIGYGHLIRGTEKKTLNKKKSKPFLLNLFEKDFNKSLNDYKKNYLKYNFSKTVEEIIIEMIFQLGIKKQKKFKKMITSLKRKEFYMASLEMMNSLWYKQTPKRVDSLIKILIKSANDKKNKRYFS